LLLLCIACDVNHLLLVLITAMKINVFFPLTDVNINIGRVRRVLCMDISI